MGQAYGGAVRQRSGLEAQRGHLALGGRREREHRGDGTVQSARQPEVAIGRERAAEVLGDPRSRKLPGGPPDQLAEQESVGHGVVAVGGARWPVRLLFFQGLDDSS
jgi:hypothetical protein